MRNVYLLFAWLSLSASSFSQNLVAYYPFNGNANDESGNARNPNYNGASLTTDRFGNANSAYAFSGATNGHIEYPAGGLPATNRTISIWFYNSDVSNRPGLFGYGGNGSCGTTLFMAINLSGSGQYNVQGHCGNNAASFTYAAAPVNNWYHWVLTINGSTQKIYVNGLLKSTDNTFSGSTATGGSAELSFGVIPHTNGLAPYTDANVGYLNGKLDDIRIYDAAMNDAQVLQLYQNELTGLVAYYPFNGNANDESGNGRNGTVMNGAYLTTDRFSNAGSAYYFDGDDDLIELSATGLPSTDRTVMFWLNPDAGNQPSYPVCYGGSSSCGYSFLTGFNASSANNYNTQGHCGSNALGTNPWTTSPANTWVHYAVSINGSNIKIYINGQLAANNNAFSNTTYTGGKKMFFGALITPDGLSTYDDGSGGNFKGKLDEVRIYNRAISPNEIAQLADIPFMPDLLAYLPMNGDADDKSGNNRHGSFNGSPPPSPTPDKYGNQGSAYQFNGNGTMSSITLANSSNMDFYENFSGKPFSLSAWVKLGASTGDVKQILGKHICGTPNGYLIIAYDGKLGFWMSVSGTWFQLTTTENYNDDKWHHVVATYDVTYQRIYVDGILKASMFTAYNNPASGVPIKIGEPSPSGGCGGNGVFNGGVDEVKIYGAALNDAQVAALYKQSRGSGNAIQLDGVDDKINVGTGWEAAEFTLETWIKPDINNNNMNTIISPEAYDGFRLTIQKVNTTGGFIYELRNGGSIIGTIMQPVDGAWHHLAITCRHLPGLDEYQWFWDGVYAGFRQVPEFIRAGAVYFLGIDNVYSNNGFSGLIDEVRFWNVILTQSQISQWMNRKITPEHPAYANLLHYFNFDEKTVSYTYDSRMSNKGILISGPSFQTYGAPVGDKSNVVTGAFNNPGATLTMNSTTGETYTATMTSGRNGGIAVYEVLDVPVEIAGITGLGNNNKYLGVFPIKGLWPPDFYILPQYSLVYNYTGNPFVSPATEPTLQLFKRADNSITTWINSGAALNTTANTLTVTGQNTEYILGSSGFGLPVTLLSFEAHKISPVTVQLNWKTATEINNKGFEVQRSFDGSYFTSIGFVNGAGNSAVMKEYRLIDIPGKTGRVFYRLKQVDFDEQAKLSQIVSVVLDKQGVIKVYPNPALHQVTIEGADLYNHIRLIDAGGRVVKEQINNGQYLVKISLEGIKSGVYLLQLSNSKENKTLKLIICN